MTNKNETLDSILIGIRYKRSFKILQNTGEIIDYILFDDKSPFSENFFPKVEEDFSGVKKLLNPDTDEFLQINQDDLILRVKASNKDTKTYDYIQKQIIPFVENLFSKFGITNFIRIGVFYTYEFNDDSWRFLCSDAENIFGSKLYNMDFSFSKKLEDAHGKYTKDIHDYKNYNYKFNFEENKVMSVFDFQKYFDPVREDFRECYFSKVFEDSFQARKDDYIDLNLKKSMESLSV